jgi:hypothetical protein
MSKKQRLLLCYILVISIIVIMVGFFGLGVRAFESAGVSSTILLAALGILVAIPPMYFVLRRPVTNAAVDPIIFRSMPRIAPWPKDRRRPFVKGQERVAFAVERRGRPGAGLLAVIKEPLAGETSHG